MTRLAQKPGGFFAPKGTAPPKAGAFIPRKHDSEKNGKRRAKKADIFSNKDDDKTSRCLLIMIYIVYAGGRKKSRAHMRYITRLPKTL
jgi:hypothetical protein